MDFFNEWIVKKKKSAIDMLIVFATCFAAIFLIYLLMAFSHKMLTFFPLLVALVIYLAYRIITGTNVEFEYSVTNGQMDVDKIIARRRRKRVCSVNSRNFEYFAPLTEQYSSAFKDSSIVKRIDASSNTNSERACFAIYYNNGEKTCIIFEPTDKMLEDFSKYVPRSLNYTR